MKIGELLVGAVFLSTAVVAFVLAGSFQSAANAADPGPAMYPRLMATLMGLCALAVMVRALRSPYKPVEGGRWQLALVSLVIAAAYLLLFEPLGYIVSTAALILVMLLLGGVRNLIQLTAVPVVYVASTYFLFSSVLMLKLP
ncbi:MAG: tripartite tricarboxylate transporter TctB family protein [Chloroflexi bacterium]|nr:tripartite tricarboxylate transporter TctB family protein [Chloroflexota bacterium]